MQDISNLLGQIRQQYIAEIPLRIETIESLILQLSDPDKFQSLFEELFRTVHSLKGSAGMHNLHILSTISHYFENQLTPIGTLDSATSTQIDNLLQYTDLLNQATGLIINNENDFSLVEKNLAQLTTSDNNAVIKILMIETSKTIINIAEQVFADYPVKITLCHDGYEALKILLIEHYDLLITNAEAPILNGIALITALKHAQDHKRMTLSMLLTSKETKGPNNRRSDSDFTVLKNKQFIENFSLNADNAIEAVNNKRTEN